MPPFLWVPGDEWIVPDLENTMVWDKQEMGTGRSSSVYTPHSFLYSFLCSPTAPLVTTVTLSLANLLPFHFFLSALWGDLELGLLLIPWDGATEVLASMILVYATCFLSPVSALLKLAK